jgi:hypothetical protein
LLFFTLSEKVEGRRLKINARVVTSLFIMLLTALPVFAERGPFVKGMTYRYKDSNLLASLAVDGAFDRPDLKEAILSTRPIRITFTIELVKHRALWTTKTIVRRKVVHSVVYDNLTRQFALETLLDGESTDRRVVETMEEVVSYMEQVTDVVVTSVANLDPSEGSYALRAQVHLLDDFALWIIPWDVQTPWATQTLSTP